jgi:dienelactone hydrolase
VSLTATRRSVGTAVALVLGLGLVLAGAAVLLSADDGLVRERTVVDGVPVTTLRPDGDGPFPAVVVAHGFSGSSTLMDGLGIAFARDGWVAALLDFRGHGGNATGLGELDGRGLEDDLRAVQQWVADRDDVEGEPALLGHSMGAGVVTRVAADDDVPGTVALSLGSADDLPLAGRGPQSLLLLTGSAEPDRFQQARQDAADKGYQTGTIAGAEHISILFRTATLTQSVEWLDDAVGRPTAGAATADWRMPAVGAVYLGSALLFWPLSGWLLRSSAGQVAERGRQLPVWLAAPLAGLVSGGVLAVLPTIGEVVPLLVGGYLAAFFALAGVLLWGLSGRWERPSPRAVGGGAALGVYAAATLALPAQLGWAQVSIAGPRGPSLLALVAAVLLYAVGETLLAWRPEAALGYGRVLLARLLLAATLVGLAVTGVAPGFLLLLAPVMVLVLPWFGAYGVRVSRLTGSPLAGAVTQALPLGLLVAIATPLA